jgi:hypothetical protein
MTTLTGNYFDGVQPIGVPGQMVFADHEVILTAEFICRRYAISGLTVSPRIGSTDRFITLPNGGQCVCADGVFLDLLPQESPSEGPVAWLERRWGVALAGIIAIVCVLLTGYFFVLPVAAERIATRIPMKTEQSLGRQAMALLDKRKWLEPTNGKLLPPEDSIKQNVPRECLCPSRGYYCHYR